MISTGYIVNRRRFRISSTVTFGKMALLPAESFALLQENKQT
jgi:hypothetical protein